MPSREEDFTQLDAWLDKLLDATPAERTQILAACADTTLRDRLCALLAAESHSGPLDETPQTLLELCRRIHAAYGGLPEERVADLALTVDGHLEDLLAAELAVLASDHPRRFRSVP